MNVPCLDNNKTNGGCLTFIIVENGFKPSYCFILKYTHDQWNPLTVGTLTFKNHIKDWYICYADQTYHYRKSYRNRFEALY